MYMLTLITGFGITAMITGAALAGQPDLIENPSGQNIMVTGNELQSPVNILYDNGGWNGINGYADFLGGEFNFDRSLLDDFTVPAGGWDIGGANTLYLWNTGGVGLGTDMTVEFYADNGNCIPGNAVVAAATNRIYSEEDAGMGLAKGRLIVNIGVSFDTIHLDPGHYWIDLQVTGNDSNGFILTADQNNCECWVDYTDFDGRQPGSNFFGVSSDIVFSLSGPEIPACLMMTVSPLIAGEFATWGISGATPGSLVIVVNGLTEGSTVVIDDMGFCATFGIAGVDRDRVIGHMIADDAGSVSMRRYIPRNLSGIAVLTQAAEGGTCPDECISDIDMQVIG